MYLDSLELGASSEQKCWPNLFLNYLFIYPLCLIDNSFVWKDVRKQTKTGLGCWSTKGCCHIGVHDCRCDTSIVLRFAKKSKYAGKVLRGLGVLWSILKCGKSGGWQWRDARWRPQSFVSFNQGWSALHFLTQIPRVYRSNHRAMFFYPNYNYISITMPEVCLFIFTCWCRDVDCSVFTLWVPRQTAGWAGSIFTPSLFISFINIWAPTVITFSGEQILKS